MIFFNDLNEIDDVIVIGYLLVEVDLLYFEYLTKSVSPSARLTVVYY